MKNGRVLPMKKTALVIMAAGVGSRFGNGIKQLAPVESIHLLEYADKGIANFHMVFLLGLLHHLGVFPNMESHRVGYYFDMLNGDRKSTRLNSSH